MGDVTRSAERVPELGMAALEPIGEGPAAGGEGDAGPGDLGGRERGDLDRLRIGSEASAHHVSLERDHDDRGLQARIEPDDLAGLSRATAMRLLGSGGLPGVRPGDMTFASNQVRIRLPRDAARAWPLTQAVVARLSAADESIETL